MLLFLKKIVPKEAKTAQKRLGQFDGVLSFMGLEERMKTGRQVSLYGRDPRAVAKEWRDVAKTYQSVLPDHDDPPDYCSKKSCVVIQNTPRVSLVIPLQSHLNSLPNLLSITFLTTTSSLIRSSTSTTLLLHFQQPLKLLSHPNSRSHCKVADPAACALGALS